MDAYSKFSMQDMSLKEAQIEYLNILSQNEIMFGSYFQAEKLASLSHTVSDPLMLGNKRGKFRQSLVKNNKLGRKSGIYGVNKDSDKSSSDSESTPDSEEDENVSSDSEEVQKTKGQQSGIVNGKTKE